jgi:hypothetical protein
MKHLAASLKELTYCSYLPLFACPPYLPPSSSSTTNLLS